MRCEEFQRRLDRLLDNRLDPDSDWSMISHAGNCDTCRRELSGQQSLAEAMKLYDPPEVPVSFAEDVVSLAAQELDWLPPRHKTRRVRMPEPRGLWFAASLAVVILVGCTLVALVSSASSDPAIEQASVLTPNSSVPPAKQDAQDPRSKVTSGEGAAPIHEGTSQNLSVQQANTRRALMSALEPLTSFEGIQSDEIPGVRPLVNSFDVTISLLKRTIPRHGSSARKRPSTSQISRNCQHVV